jgi:hypothetical protein
MGLLRLDHLIAFFTDRLHHLCAWHVGFNFYAATAAVNLYDGAWVQCCDRVPYRFFAVAAGHALYAKELFHEGVFKRTVESGLIYICNYLYIIINGVAVRCKDAGRARMVLA